MAMTDSDVDSQRARLRHVNERMARLLGKNEVVSLLCECGSGYCVEQVSMTPSQFESIKGEGRFVLAPGHRI